MRVQTLTWKTIEEETPKEGVDLILGLKDGWIVGRRYGNQFAGGRDEYYTPLEILEWSYLDN